MRTQALKTGRILATVVTLVLLAAGPASCGSSQSEALGDNSPQAVLNAALETAKNVESISGNFEVAVTVELDQTQVPQEAVEFLGQPIKISGNFAAAGPAQKAEYVINLSMAGKTMPVAARLAENKAWLQLGNQWYEAPPELLQQAGQFPYDKQKREEISRLLDDLGFDPASWFKELQVAGEEKFGEAATYHLIGTPDPAKMVADMVGLMESQELMKLINPGGTVTEGLGAGMIPSAEELKELESQATQIFRNLKAEFWITKKSQELRKLVVDATLAPPVGKETDGLKSISMAVVLNLDKYNQAVTVEAPTAALPFAELERVMNENPEQVLGPFMELMGSMGQNF